MRQFYLAALIINVLFSPALTAQVESTDLALTPLLTQATNDYPILKKVIAKPEHYKVQVIYTQIERDAANRPTLRRYLFNLDDSRYYYPASTVKLPIALLALEWLNQQDIAGLNKDTAMLTDAATDWQTEQWNDSSSVTGVPSIAQYIKKILLVSDNDGSNRLYELLGPDYLNQRLIDKGLQHTLINHRLSVSLSPEQNHQVNPIRFIDQDKVILQLPARTATKQYVSADKPKLGKAYMQGGQLIEEPMDFTEKNRFSLSDFDGVLKRLVFPQLFSPEHRFDLSAKDREFVLRYMAMSPPESISPRYDANQFPPNYAKFLLFGGEPQQLPEHIKIFNKSGWAYGYNIDGAYIVDIQNRVEFFVTAVIYANANDILNDDKYQRSEIALPFLRQLGQYLYEYELKQVRKHRPDLTEVQRITDKYTVIE